MNYHYSYWRPAGTICQASRVGTEFSIRASGTGNTDAAAQNTALTRLIIECQKAINDASEELKEIERAGDYNQKESDNV